MRARLFSLSIFLVSLLGCTSDPYTWRHPTKNSHDLAAEKEQCELTAAAEYPSKEILAPITPAHTVRCYSLGNGARDCGSEYGSYHLPAPIYLGNHYVAPYLYPYLPVSSYRPPLYMPPSYTTNGGIEVYHVPPGYHAIDGNLDQRESAIKKCLRTKGWQLERVEKK